MGKSNRQRRAEKRRRRQRQHGEFRARSQRHDAPAQPSVDDCLEAAIQLAAQGDAGALRNAVAALMAWPRDRVDQAIVARLNHRLWQTWEGGWQPAELVAAVRRRLTPRHGELVASAVVYDGRQRSQSANPPPAWVTQIRDLESTLGRAVSRAGWWPQWCAHAATDQLAALETVIELLAVFTRLPKLSHLLPPPSAWGDDRHLAPASRPADDPLLQRVRSLLAKAESTSFPEEADALTAKAQQLMARHAIDDAMLGRSSGVSGPQVRRFWPDSPYMAAKAELLAVVVGANRGRSVWEPNWGFMTVVAHPHDLDAIDMLFTSLLVQATRAMLAKGRQDDRFGRSRTRSFRQSFLVAFAGRIHERLVAAATAAQREAATEHGGMLLPVLAARADAVDEKVAELFPRLRPFMGLSATNREGWVAGRAAAEMARLGPEAEELSVG